MAKIFTKKMTKNIEKSQAKCYNILVNNKRRKRRAKK